MAEKLRIGILGRGNVGSALKRGLERAGYSPAVAGREREKIADIARKSELIVLATPFPAVAETLNLMGKVNGKTIVDVTNLYTPEMKSSAGAISGAEFIQKKVPEAHVVKAFNMHFAKNMETGRVGNEQLTLFIAGDDADSKQKTAQMGRDLGFDVVDAGPLKNAELLEALGNLNIQLGYSQGLGTDIGFKLVRRK